MRLVLFFVAGSLASAAYAQSDMKRFARQQAHRDSVQAQQLHHYLQSRRIAPTIQDSVNQRTMLLVADEEGTYSYRAGLNQQAAITTGASLLQDETKGYRLTGKGITCGIWEDGLVKTHAEFGNRILSKEGAFERTHATHVAGTILASGINPSAKGMAPEASAYTFYFDNDVSEMAALASEGEESLLFSNHSYGTVTGWSRPNGVWTWYGDTDISTDEDYRHGFYNWRAQRVDELAYLSPYYTIVWAAGNDRFETGDGTYPADCNRGTGYDCIIPDATAKNIITVGAAQKVLNYTSPSSVAMSWFSSWGPTDDGRIKPDLVAAGVDLFSLSADGANTYAYSTGTSMATPNVTGSLMLLQQLHARLNAGHYLKASTLKALAIHTAKEAGLRDGPDYQFGWGLLDVKAAADVLIKVDGDQTRLIESTLEQGEVYQFQIEPKADQKVTLTLCWTDPEGTTPAPALDPLTKMLVNDLDVRLIDENGVVTLPWTLDPSVPQAQATQSDNVRDNVEKIELKTPLNKKYTVLVRHKNTLKFGKQDFSLVITYTARTEATQTFYWIGNSGNWEDGSHWSFVSGGVAANQIPGEGDIAIVDESSLEDGGVIVANEDIALARLIWLNSADATLDVQSNTVTIESHLTLGNNLTVGGSGSFAFEGDNGVVNFLEADLGSNDLKLAGSWNINGSFSADTITLIGGECTWNSHVVKANAIEVGDVIWNISETRISLAQKLAFEAVLNNFNSAHAHIEVESETCEIDWRGNTFNGTLSVNEGAAATFLSEGSVRTITIEGKLDTKADFEMDSLVMKPGSEWLLGDDKKQTIKKHFQAEASPDAETSITSPSKATLVLNVHQKICLNHMLIQNVDVEGLAVLNAGVSSAIQNSEGWLQLPCEEVLFAEFSFDYLCQNGLTTFTDLSIGSPQTWMWQFEGASPSINQSNQQYPAVSFGAEGEALVTLTITTGQQTTTHSKTLMVQSNSFPANEIIVTGENKLMSLLTAPAYQWYTGLILIESANQRNFETNQDPGEYQVVISDAHCNRISLPYVISGIEESKQYISIYPNPAYSTVTISADENLAAPGCQLLDTMGRVYREIPLNETIDIANYRQGVYWVKTRSRSGKDIVKKMLVIH